MTKELDLIELFAPKDILQDFNFEKLVDESGVCRIYMVEKDDADHLPAELKKGSSEILCDDLIVESKKS